MCPHLQYYTEQEVAGYPINVYAGGASLISPRFLLTAAHIFNTDGQYAIRSVLCRFLFGSLQCVLIINFCFRCGDWDTMNTNELYPHQERLLLSMDTHPDFNPANFKSDVAVLEVTEPFLLQPNVDTMCLPPPGQIYDGRLCAATGWGKDRFGRQENNEFVVNRIAM